ncbi:hypothetical protein SAMN04515695_3324 [Pseudovibrio sp. Tun.PSC04-5.I4]|nr:hypothetical protein SAMN04515695_3324 [Pseudovibrio sp. Tun.PSC04-5.I4]
MKLEGGSSIPFKIVTKTDIRPNLGQLLARARFLLQAVLTQLAVEGDITPSQVL